MYYNYRFALLRNLNKKKICSTVGIELASPFVRETTVRSGMRYNSASAIFTVHQWFIIPYKNISIPHSNIFLLTHIR